MGIISKIGWGIMIIFIILGLVGTVWMVVDTLIGKEKACDEVGGVLSFNDCANEKGVYKIVYLNRTWKAVPY